MVIQGHMFLGGRSRVEMIDAAGHLSRDPETAHSAAGDPGYTRRIEDCFICQAEVLAEAAAAEEALDDGD